jgi:hypothetical protein
MSSIQDNVFEKENDGTQNQGNNNWVKFFTYCILFFMISLIILVLGSNFIFISNTDDSILNNILPININAYFKNDQQDGGGYSCGMKGKSSYLNWPYSMRKSEANTRGIIQRFKNWFAITTADTFIMNRKLIRDYVTLFSPINNIFLIFLISILTISISPLVYIISLGSALFHAFKTNWKWALFALIFIFLWPFIIGISIVQLLQFIYLFLLMPAITDMDVLKDIIKCNVNIFFIVFGGLVSIASLLSLNSTISIIYTVLYLIMSIV